MMKMMKMVMTTIAGERDAHNSEHTNNSKKACRFAPRLHYTKHPSITAHRTRRAPLRDF